MDLRNSNGIEFMSFYFTNQQKLFSKIFPRSGKVYHVGLNLGASKSNKENIFLYF